MTTQIVEPPRLERPRPARLPEVQRRLEVAAGLRREGENLIAQSSTATTAANILEQRISGLTSERTAIQQRLANIEGNDVKARLEQCRATVRDLYGITNLGSGQIVSLNEATIALAWLPELAKEIPAIVKNLKGRLAEIDAEIKSLEAE